MRVGGDGLQCARISKQGSASGEGEMCSDSQAHRGWEDWYGAVRGTQEDVLRRVQVCGSACPL